MRKKPYTLRFHTNTYKYLGNHPSERSHKWAENAQGVTHDTDHWYLSNDAKLFKYHVATDINSNDTLATAGMPSALASLGYVKFKALTHHEGFLFVPVVGQKPPAPLDNLPITDPGIGASIPIPDAWKNPPAAVAMFRASDLGYVSHIVIPESLGLGNPGWLAIHPKEGRLYTSSSQLTYTKGLKVFDFAINPDGSGFSMTYSHQLVPRLRMELTSMQGGVFSPEGQLYIVNGYYDTDVDKGGISVFGLHDFRFEQKSQQSGDFRFEWDTSSTVSEEPEGVTFWDLDDDGRAPKISGQLHVLLLDNDWPDDDDVYMKHYRMSDPIPAPIPQLSLRHAFLGDEAVTAASPVNLRGITHDHKHRFLATTTTLSKTPILADNPENLPSAMASWPDALAIYPEIGDICHFDGHILVPFSGDGRNAAVAIFDADSLALRARATLAQNTRIACLGIDAITREHLHAVDVGGNGRKYRIEIASGQWKLIPEGGSYRFDDRNSPKTIEEVTGGEISTVSGFFYLAHDGEISVFHSDGAFVDSSAFDHETFDAPDYEPRITQLTTDCWHEPFPPGTDFDNVADVTALVVSPSSASAALRSWEIDPIHLIGNKRSKEVHLQGCPFQKRMALPNYVPFTSMEAAIASGYNGCYYCLKKFDTG